MRTATPLATCAVMTERGSPADLGVDLDTPVHRARDA